MSTARHQLAGAPGTGTTVDNMASRCKAWANVNQLSAPATVRQGFNVSSINDSGVGATNFNFASVMANNTYASCAGYTFVTGGIASVFAGSSALFTAGLSWSLVGGATAQSYDTSVLMMQCSGDLA